MPRPCDSLVLKCDINDDDHIGFEYYDDGSLVSEIECCRTTNIVLHAESVQKLREFLNRHESEAE